MPGFDGSGPQGMGPMTGGARGFCNPRGAAYPAGYGAGRGMACGRGGYGFGRGMAYGRGMRRGSGAGGMYPIYPPYPYSEENELNMLRSQAAAIKDNLERINQRITELGKDPE